MAEAQLFPWPSAQETVPDDRRAVAVEPPPLLSHAGLVGRILDLALAGGRDGRPTATDPPAHRP
ncbi:hypothetical protein ACWELO_23675 [Streptomyces sp. NPDC004596]